MKQVIKIKTTKPKYICFKCDNVAEYQLESNISGSKARCHICGDCLFKLLSKSIKRTERKKKEDIR